jgi:gliding motility-associated-like protein
MLFSGFGWSQTFPVPGQQPTTAFPVCGYDTFKQSVVPFGANGAIDYALCHKPPDFCPFYYSFTCYVGGTLGFVIEPDKADDDYDWMLFDITGHDPNEIFSKLLVVIGNWSGTPGTTGAKEGGSPNFECGSEAALNHLTFSYMPTLIKGHKYLLLVSNFSETQTGYTLSFGGGTAVLNDPVPPHLQSAFVGCDKNIITIVLDKKVRCNSLAPDGSDFIPSSGSYSIVSATGANCNNQFDMDTIQLMLSAPLPAGNYSVSTRTGTDGNTLLDDCGSPLATGEKKDFLVSSPQITPMDSLTPLTCAPRIIQLVFSAPMECSSIAADGSDFTISGNSVVGISRAEGICADGLTRVINITLSSPLVVGGNYLIRLKSGSDGNTINNECGLATPSGSMISFSARDTVSASFNYNIAYGCKYDTINLSYLLANGVNQWLWKIDGSISSNLLSPSIPENLFGLKKVQHTVSNGICMDTVNEIVNLDNQMKAAFQSPGEVCPKDVIRFSENSSGNLVSWYWDFGDGTSSNDQNPPAHLFPDTWAGKIYTVSLTVKNNLGCLDSVSIPVTKKQSCYISVPNAFTPNGDGKNDFLYPLNAFSAVNLEFMIFNRFGQLIFETRDWTRKWDGSINGSPQGTGTYIWTLKYTDGLTGKNVFLRGTSVLIR